ncbi:hypothetical protein GCM10009105_04560 [Dokdonella soli]|uniref:DUF433 domain-containing protein n=1 Tax=Dokdonella soli TaxID=529810 RepID=A0ABN1ICC0_9GAMM
MVTRVSSAKSMQDMLRGYPPTRHVLDGLLIEYDPALVLRCGMAPCFRVQLAVVAALALRDGMHRFSCDLLRPVAGASVGTRRESRNPLRYTEGTWHEEIGIRYLCRAGSRIRRV